MAKAEASSHQAYRILRRLPGYSVGDALRGPDAILTCSPEGTAFAASRLRAGDCAFVRRSDGSFTYALYEGHNDGDRALSFQVDGKGRHYKLVPARQLLSRVKVPVLPAALVGTPVDAYSSGSSSEASESQRQEQDGTRTAYDGSNVPRSSSSRQLTHQPPNRGLKLNGHKSLSLLNALPESLDNKNNNLLANVKQAEHAKQSNRRALSKSFRKIQDEGETLISQDASDVSRSVSADQLGRQRQKLMNPPRRLTLDQQLHSRLLPRSHFPESEMNGFLTNGMQAGQRLTLDQQLHSDLLPRMASVHDFRRKADRAKLSKSLDINSGNSLANAKEEDQAEQSNERLLSNSFPMRQEKEETVASHDVNDVPRPESAGQLGRHRHKLMNPPRRLTLDQQLDAHSLLRSHCPNSDKIGLLPRGMQAGQRLTLDQQLHSNLVPRTVTIHDFRRKTDCAKLSAVPESSGHSVEPSNGAFGLKRNNSTAALAPDDPATMPRNVTLCRLLEGGIASAATGDGAGNALWESVDDRARGISSGENPLLKAVAAVEHSEDDALRNRRAAFRTNAIAPGGNASWEFGDNIARSIAAGDNPLLRRLANVEQLEQDGHPTPGTPTARRHANTARTNGVVSPTSPSSWKRASRNDSAGRACVALPRAKSVNRGHNDLVSYFTASRSRPSHKTL